MSNNNESIAYITSNIYFDYIPSCKQAEGMLDG